MHVHPSRSKLLFLTVGSTLFALLSLLVGLTGEPVVLLGVPAFGAMAIVGVRALRRRGPALIIDDQGIEDTRPGIRLAWDEIESIRVWTSYRSLIPRRELLVRVRNLQAIENRMAPGLHRRLARVSRRMGFQTMAISLSMLSMRHRQILDAVRKHYGGLKSD
ncbi:MAG TPA: STM3941 family protein [Actinomycetota bacterium]|jgi:hypothetical protein|nr:STM3941 family protein [Actinomycetota bacterium]